MEDKKFLDHVGLGGGGGQSCYSKYFAWGITVRAGNFIFLCVDALTCRFDETPSSAIFT